MNKLNSRTISINALAIALVCLSTMFLQFPIPLGYAHLGNCFILISGDFFGPVTGLLDGGIGSALSDLLTGYAQWIIPTLIIKGIMGFVIGYIANRTGLTVNMFKIRTAAASIVGIIIMVVGYFIGGYLLYKRKDELKEKLSVSLLSAVFIGSILMITLLVCADSFAAHDFRDAFLTYGELFMMLSSTSAFLLNTRFKAKQHRLFDWFGPLTFGVYLIHPIFIDIAKEFIRFPWASALYIPLLLIVILIVSSLIVWVLSKLPGLKKIVS